MKKCISLLLFMVGFSFFLASCNYDYQNPVDQLKTHVVKGKVVKPVDGSVKEAIAGCQVKLIGSVLAVETDQTGQFTFYDFPPTHQRGKQEKQVAHTMQIWCEEGDWQKLVQDIHLEAENALDLGVIVLEKAADLKGKVSADSKSKDLTGIKVALAHTYYTTYTDKDGEYHFKKIAPGNYQLVAFHSQMGLGR